MRISATPHLRSAPAAERRIRAPSRGILPGRCTGLAAGLLLALLSTAPAAAQSELDPLPQLPQADGLDLPLSGIADETAGADAPAPITPGTDTTPVLPEGREATPPAMADCARALLRTRLASAVSGEDLLAALAVETELLVLCRERQALVASILEGELRLAALQAAADEDTAAEEDPVPGAPDDLLDQLGSPAAAAPSAVTPSFTAEPAAAPAAEPEPAAGIGWFSIVGSAGDLRAGLTDGIEAWWVRTGSTVRGMRVSRIGTHPPGVEVEAGGATHVLPHRPRWPQGDG